MTNPNTNLSELRTLAREIQQAAPLLTTGHHLSPWLRGECERLAVLANLTADLASKANDNDLISIYLTARRDGVAALRVAERVALRLDPTFFPAPTPRAPDRTVVGPAPRTVAKWIDDIPVAPEPTTDLDALRALIKQEVEGGVLAPIQTALETLAGEHQADLERVSAEAAVSALEAMRDQMASEAHAAAAAALQAMQPTRLDVYDPRQLTAPVSLGLVHRETPKIINALSAGVNVYLHGPAGSGKTTCARKCAEAFSLPFHFAAKVESEYQLTGFKDAKGDTVRTPFREAYEHGGVFLFDEMDASSPSAVVAMNAALANGICPFPDGTVARHAQFYCIGAGNTKLTGANRQYAGRNQLDAASIDRFAFIEFGYDDDLELALAPDVSWARYVQSVRRAVADRGLNHLVTPRATYDGCKLLAAGFDRDVVRAMVVYKGLDADTIRQIEAAL